MASGENDCQARRRADRRAHRPVQLRTRGPRYNDRPGAVPVGAGLVPALHRPIGAGSSRARPRVPLPTPRIEPCHSVAIRVTKIEDHWLSAGEDLTSPVYEFAAQQPNCTPHRPAAVRSTGDRLARQTPDRHSPHRSRRQAGRFDRSGPFAGPYKSHAIPG